MTDGQTVELTDRLTEIDLSLLIFIFDTFLTAFLWLWLKWHAMGLMKEEVEYQNAEDYYVASSKIQPKALCIFMNNTQCI